MILELINLFAMYLLLSLFFGIVIKIFPQFIQQSFSIFQILRIRISRFIQSIYRTQQNFEVNMLAIFLAPFGILLLIFSILQTWIFFYPQFAAINIFIMIMIAFLIAAIIPSETEMAGFAKVNPSSLFIFFLKLALIIQLVIEFRDHIWIDEIAILLFVFPISPYAVGSDYQSYEYDAYPTK